MEDIQDTMPPPPPPPPREHSSRFKTIDSCLDHGDRLRAVEDSMRDLSTIKKLVGGILLLGLPVVVSGIYQNIVNSTNQQQMAAQVAGHDSSLHTLTTATGEIRSDVRVLITEFRAAEARRQDRDQVLTERLQRLEAATLVETRPHR